MSVVCEGGRNIISIGGSYYQASLPTSDFWVLVNHVHRFRDANRWLGILRYKALSGQVCSGGSPAPLQFLMGPIVCISKNS